MIWIIGSGNMAIEYSKVLNSLNLEYIVIGRGSSSADKYESIINKNVFQGGLDKFLENEPKNADSAIVTVGMENLAETTSTLIRYGVKKILVEKPAGLNIGQVQSVSDLAKKTGAEVYIAYNRRFYASVLKSQELINEDGGVKSFNFEFTEWAHKIKEIPKAEGVKENWFFGNSTHVVDLAFYLGGFPEKLSAYTAGSNKISWHPSASIYAGAGIADTGALFNYSANWTSPGRWSVEVITDKHRYIFRPLEKLFIQNVGSVQINEVEGIDYHLDEEYKPGLYRQVEAFLSGGNSGTLLSINGFQKYMEYYKIIGNL